MTLHVECTDLVATALDDVNTGATQDPKNPVFVGCCVSYKTLMWMVNEENNGGILPLWLTTSVFDDDGKCID